MLLTIDDAHWSDIESLGFLGYLARRISDLDALLLIGIRSTDPEARSGFAARLRDEEAASVISPTPLSVDAIAGLVERRLGETPAHEFSDACHRASGGIPFLIGGLLESLAADRIAPVATEAAAVSGLVPAAVGRHVFARLARLPADAAELARAVTVLGDGVDLDTAARYAALDADAAIVAADALVKAELLSAGPAPELIHPLVREAIYDELPSGARAHAHVRAATLLNELDAPADRIAAQLLAAPPVGERWAVEMLRQAAADAQGRGAPRTAARYLRRALEEPTSGAIATEVQIELASAELTSGSPARASEELERALEEEPDARATVGPLLHVAQWGAGRFRDAIATADHAAPVIGPANPETARLLELNAALAILQRQGFAEASARFEQIAAAAGDSPETFPLLARVIMDLAERAPAREAIERAEGVADRLDGVVPPLGLQPFVFLVVALHTLDRHQTALRLLERTISGAQGRGDTPTLMVALDWRGWNALDRGALQDSLADCEQAIAVSSDAELHMFDPVPAMLRMRIAAEIDPHGELAEHAEVPFERTEDGSDDGYLWARGVLRLAQERHEDARSDLAEAAAGYDRMGVPALAGSVVRPYLVRAITALGEHREARELVSEDLARADRIGTPRLRGMAFVSEALTRSPGERVDPLRRAVDALERSPARLDLAYALCELGSAMRREGERTASREPLRRARELAHASGSSRLEERAHEELLASGARPRRIPTTGVESLTPSERRVAQLAAEGQSNREIAQSLFLSRRTVEMHLTRAYRKLEIGSRSELPGTLKPRKRLPGGHRGTAPGKQP